MKTYFIISFIILLTGSLFGQRLFIPYLDKASQSNVIVTISGAGQPCSLEYTNKLSNTNLFTPIEQNLIKEIFIKYKDVTTNSGPSGTVLIGFYKTNHIVKDMNRTFEIENWVSQFQYTNSDAQEEIRLGEGGLFAQFRNKAGDGYSASFIQTGDGTMMRFMERKNNSINGVFAAFEDMHWQGTNWDFRLSDFSDSRVTEYRYQTNRMVFGKYLMWNPRNNNLIMEAEFTEPYDFEKHRIDLMH